MLFDDYAEKWMASREGILKISTLRHYRSMLRTHLSPAFGKKELKTLKSDDFEVWLRIRYEERKTSANTVAQAVGLLKRMMSGAVKSGLLAKNPAEGVTVRNTDSTVRALTEREQTQLERFIILRADPRYYGILISLYTGLRLGEVLALRWENVNRRDRILTVEHTLNPVRVRDPAVLGTPKTMASRREVPYPCVLDPFLRALRAQGSEYVVSNRNGSFVEVRSYQRTFGSVLNRCGLKKRGFHCLRHTFATRAAEDGADIKTLSEILGHTNPSVTLKRYVHSSEKQKNTLVNRVGARLKRLYGAFD